MRGRPLGKRRALVWPRSIPSASSLSAPGPVATSVRESATKDRPAVVALTRASPAKRHCLAKPVSAPGRRLGSSYPARADRHQSPWRSRWLSSSACWHARRCGLLVGGDTTRSQRLVLGCAACAPLLSLASPRCRGPHAGLRRHARQVRRSLSCYGMWKPDWASTPAWPWHLPLSEEPQANAALTPRIRNIVPRALVATEPLHQICRCGGEALGAHEKKLL